MPVVDRPIALLRPARLCIVERFERVEPIRLTPLRILEPTREIVDLEREPMPDIDERLRLSVAGFLATPECWAPAPRRRLSDCGFLATPECCGPALRRRLSDCALLATPERWPPVLLRRRLSVCGFLATPECCVPALRRRLSIPWPWARPVRTRVVRWPLEPRLMRRPSCDGSLATPECCAPEPRRRLSCDGSLATPWRPVLVSEAACEPRLEPASTGDEFPVL